MPYNESRKKASIKYAKEHLKRVPLDLSYDKYNEVKAAADESGESVNGYIKKAIDERIERQAKKRKQKAVK